MVRFVATSNEYHDKGESNPQNNEDGPPGLRQPIPIHEEAVPTQEVTQPSQ